MGLKPHRIQVRGVIFWLISDVKSTLHGVVLHFFSPFPPPREGPAIVLDMFERVLEQGALTEMRPCTRIIIVVARENIE